MKIKKTILTCVMGTAATLALASCSSLSETVPYGNIDDTVYASTASGYSVSKRQIYNTMRSQGYSYVTQQIKEFVLAKDIAEVNYSDTETKYKINELIVNALLSTSDMDAIKALRADKKTYKQTIEKYIDTLANEGITVTASDLDFNFTDDGKIDATFKNELVNKYIYNVAYENYGLRNLTADSLLEKIDDEDNANYISEEDVIDTYDTYKEYANYNAIIVSFSSKKAALEACASLGEITDANKLQAFINLYNSRYSFKDAQLSTDNYVTHDDTNFEFSSTKNELNSISATFATAFANYEDGEFTATPVNFGNKYYMFYRINTEYELNKEFSFDKLNEVVEFEDLTAEKKTEVLAYLREKLVESKLSSTYTDAKIAEEYDITTDIRIYDPLMEFYFKRTYEDYEYTKKKQFNSDLIFSLTLDGKEYTYSVDDFYKELDPVYGVDAATSYLTAMYLNDTKVLTDELDSDTIKGFSTDLKSTIKSFKNNSLSSSGFPKDMGLDNFLLTYYGFSTQDEILNYYYKANSLNDIYKTKYNYTLTDGNVFDVNTPSLFSTFAKYTQSIQENFFSADIDHILISFDQNYDGNMDNPELFRSSLTENERARFDQALLDLSKAILAETKAITVEAPEAFAYLVKAFELGKPLQASGYEGKTWDDFKTFNFSLTAESLGTIDSSNATNYVETFSKSVKNLYTYLLDTEFDFEENDGYLQFSNEDDTFTSTSQLCETTYGFHILYVNDITDNTNCKFTAESDSKLDSDDEYKSYEHKSVLIIDNEDDDDDVYAYADCYSETDFASANQLFIYFFEYQSVDGVTTFRTSLETAISKVFDQVITRYTSDSFQTYRLLNELGTITFADASNTAKYENSLRIIERQIDNYNADSEFFSFDGWFEDNWKLA